MIVQNAMTKNVITVKPETSVSQAAKTMNENRISGVVVVEDERVVGILTERDIISKIVSQGKDASSLRVGEIMSKPVKTIAPETDLEEAATIMVRSKIKRLPVIENQKLAGILTSADIVSFYIDADKIVWESAIKNLAKVKMKIREIRETE